jgi:transcriptional regulator with XRE-family HTH domain
MGTRLKMLRQAAGLSQVRLAAMVGASPRAVQNWEYGRRTFDFAMAVRLAHSLGVSLDELAGIGQPKKK